MTANTTPLLLAAWSVKTTQAEKYKYRNSQPYRDTPRSKWEADRAAGVPKKAEKAGAA